MSAPNLADIIALTQLKGVDSRLLMRLREKGISASEFLSMSASSQGEACGLLSLTPWSESDILHARQTGEKESAFCQRHNIKVLSPICDDYPRRLDVLDYAPPILFMLGNADLDALHIIGVVGTRRVTPLNHKFTQDFVEELGQLVHNPVIVSGLAYGVDAAAHTAALDNELPTIAVLAHGLSMIYPAAHRTLAEKIVNAGGGLLTQYLSSEKPFKGKFLERNRIIAAISDGVLVVESAIKGGAMNTAHAASDFSRTVMAVPGRPGDAMSEGCNQLIRNQIAVLTSNARQACDSLGWAIAAKGDKKEDPTLFREPDAELLPIYKVIQESSEPVGIDFLTVKCGLPPSRISSMLFFLEEEGFVLRMPNNRYTVS